MKYETKDGHVVEAHCLVVANPTRVPGHTGYDCTTEDGERINVPQGVENPNATISTGDFLIVDGGTQRIVPADEFDAEYQPANGEEAEAPQEPQESAEETLTQQDALGDEGNELLDEETE